MTNFKRFYFRSKLTVAFFLLIRNPSDLQRVFELSDELIRQATPEQKAEYLALLRENELLAKALLERPRLGKVDLSQLARLPAGTLGYEYARFMRERGLNPEDLRQLTGSDELEYLVAHLTETHDIWHVLVGMETDIPGELGLQAFNMAQFPSRLAPLLIAAGLLHAAFFNVSLLGAIMKSIATGWMTGRSSETLLGRDWSALWEKPIAEIRAMLRLPLPIAGEAV